jgi:diguanylate cyclase (GGDEF)-like protein
MIIPIILAFTLGTRNSGLKWSGVVFATHLVMIAIDRWLFKFPQLLDMSQALTHHVMHWAITYFAIIFLMMVFESITQRLKEERDAERDRYAYLATHDPLTGLANRSMFDSQLLRALANSSRQGNLVGLMIVDLDGFKPINDTLGHDAGDKVLVAIADRLNLLLRKTDTVARIGGDEFAIILENIASPSVIDVIAQRVIDEIGLPYRELPVDLRVGASVGIALYPDHAGDCERLRIFADRAMYEAKKSHNCYRTFSPNMRLLVA